MQRPRFQMPTWVGQLPLVSLGLAGVWLLSALVLSVAFRGDLDRTKDELVAAARFAIQHPEVKIHPRLLPVAQELMPGFESNEMFDFLRGKAEDEGGTQDQFNGLAAESLAGFDAHPTRRLGLVPASPAPHAFFTHTLVHAGILHACLTLLVFLLGAPLLERLWGWRVFVPSLALMAIGGAGAFLLARFSADRALLGGGAMLAGIVAAVVVRFRAEELDFLEWLRPSISAELVAPAWALAALWVVYEVLAWQTVPAGVPGLDHAVGFAAHAGGAGLGALVALTVQRMGWEAAPPEKPRPTSPARFDLAEVMALRQRGDADAAFELLEAAVKRSARNRDAVTLFFQMCVEREEPDRAAVPVIQLVREELRRGADEIAVARWRELIELVPDASFDPVTLLRLAQCVQRDGDTELAAAAVHQILAADELASSVAAQVARLASELSPELAAAAAGRALDDAGLDAAVRTEMQALLEGAGDEAKPDVLAESPIEVTGKELPPNVFYDQQDRSAFGAVDDLSAVEDFPKGAVTEAVPSALDLEGATLQSEEHGEIRVDFARVRAISVAGVHGLGAKPVLLIDVLVDGGGTPRPLSAYRLRSDCFDPRTLAPSASGAMDALRSIVGQLLAGSEGLPLPDAPSAVLQPPKMFESLEAYERAVLTPAGQQLA